MEPPKSMLDRRTSVFLVQVGIHGLKTGHATKPERARASPGEPAGIGVAAINKSPIPQVPENPRTRPTPKG